MMHSVLAVCLGACAGALTRWGLMSGLNSAFPYLPPGTLLANLLGGYLMGLAMAWLAGHTQVSHELRLFVVVGFLGSLTTFSGFSAEVVGLIQQERLFWAVATIGAHTLGALLMTLLGLMTVQFLAR